MEQRETAASCGGCVLSIAGATAAALTWASSARTRRHMGAGFEGEGTDYSVLLTELPLVVAAGAALPALACALLIHQMRRRRRKTARDTSRDTAQNTAEDTAEDTAQATTLGVESQLDE
ncbi:hypothetical protein [Streptomyces sp. 2A115]|uniref:hypothetical protein n=1 Tax=Streptomyces sp. 2A115 TaxID=3457439 RepID=UPI003FD04599